MVLSAARILPSIRRLAAFLAIAVAATASRADVPPPSSAAPAASSVAAPAASGALAPDADDLFRSGGTAYDAGDFERAHAIYTKVFALRQTYEVAAMLAQTELKLDRPCDAAAHLEIAVARFPPGVVDERRTRIDSARAAAKSMIGSLRVVVSPADAAVSVDFVDVPASARKAALCVKAGDRTLFLSRDGFAVERRMVTVHAGAEVVVSVELRRLGAAAASSSASAAPSGDPPPSAPVRPSDPALPIAFAALAIGLAGVTAGAVLLPIASAREDEADRVAATLRAGGGPAACARPSDFTSRCDELRGLRADAAAFGSAGLSALVAGAALGAAAGGFLLFRASIARGRPGGPRVTVGAAPGGASIALKGAF